MLKQKRGGRKDRERERKEKRREGEGREGRERGEGRGGIRECTVVIFTKTYKYINTQIKSKYTNKYICTYKRRSVWEEKAK